MMIIRVIKVVRVTKVARDPKDLNDFCSHSNFNGVAGWTKSRMKPL